jgi:hypothetical protein
VKSKAESSTARFALGVDGCCSPLNNKIDDDGMIFDEFDYSIFLSKILMALIKKVSPTDDEQTFSRPKFYCSIYFARVSVLC